MAKSNLFTIHAECQTSVTDPVHIKLGHAEVPQYQIL